MYRIIVEDVFLRRSLDVESLDDSIHRYDRFDRLVYEDDRQFSFEDFSNSRITVKHDNHSNNFYSRISDHHVCQFDNRNFPMNEFEVNQYTNEC